MNRAKALVLLLFGVFLIAGNLKAQQVHKLKFEQDTLVFEKIKDGEKIRLTYNFTVVSSDPVYIHQIYPGCSCTTTEYSKDTLAPGAKGQINVVFDSKGWGKEEPYEVDKHIYVLYNGGSQVIFFRGPVVK